MASQAYGSIGNNLPTSSAISNGLATSETTPLVNGRLSEKGLLKENLIADKQTIWSRLIFKWFTPILYRGNDKKRLDPKDLDLVPLPNDCDTDYVTKTFEACWKKELEKNPSNPSLFVAICHAFGREFIYAGFLKLIHDLCVFVGPQVLNKMIVYLRQPDSDLSKGLWLTTAVTISQLMMSLCLRHYFFKCYTTGLRIRSSMITAIYQKALILSAEERQTRSLGEITNLMSIDAQRLQDLTTYVHSIWSSPLQIALALYFLWRQLGVSSIGGVAVIMIMIPVTKNVSQWMGGMQKVLMKAKDKRTELNGEVLSSMKIVKFQAWEEPFQQRILALRDAELRLLFRYYVGSSFSKTLWVFTPLAVAVSSFSCYVWLGNQLNVEIALTSLALFDILRFPLFMLPQIITRIVEAFISLKRVRSFMLCSEYRAIGDGKISDTGIELRSISATYGTNRPKSDSDDSPTSKSLLTQSWEISILRAQLEEAEFQIRKLSSNSHLLSEYSNDDVSSNMLCLRRISLQCQPGDFIAIVGGVGGGKSSIMNSILGEVHQLSGAASVKGKLAYFSQAPFIMNASLRDNILFGHVGEDVDEDLYQRCLDCCALRHDLDLLPDGDQTEIGEKGITLSGGQKARVALARAVYHQGDINLLDDVLCSVDAHVAKHLFEKAIVGELLSSFPGRNGAGQRSVVLVTNAIQYLNHPRVTKIVVVEHGRIVEEGNFKSLSTNPSSVFSRFISVVQESHFAGVASGDASDDKDIDPTETLKTDAPETKLGKTSNRTPIKLIGEESRETGVVGLHVYLTWAKAAGGLGVPIIFICVFIIVEGLSVASNWWLTYWSANADSGKSQAYFLSVYAAISFSTAIAGFFRMIFVQYFGIRASRKLFSDMLEVVLHAKMSFFDVTPVGRLVNRFSKDIYTTDEQLTETMRTYLGTLFAVVSTVVVISGVTPLFTLCLFPMILFYLIEQRFFTLSYRELKRLDSTTRSPIYALLGESVDGAAVIRAFAAQQTLFTRLKTILSKQQHAYFLTCAAQSWLAVRLELIGTLIVTFACLNAVFQQVSGGSNANFAGLAGLAISYALSATQSLNWSVRMASDMEAAMVAVERIEEYTKLESEGSRITKVDAELPQTWPNAGEIIFDGVKLSYRPELPLVLKGLDLKIPAGSKVGVVGRTGAGKSTLMVALMRIVELNEGRILIDGTDTRSIGLVKLRSNIAVIPQDPVLFSGCVRSNLDPFQEHSDDTLFDALEQVGLSNPKSSGTSSNNLTTLANARVNSLDDAIAEGGTNFSVGQRQLIVIARALLSGCKVVISDEATASIDNETDDAIQKVLRTKFVNATCITVAHRLNTIMDSDYILVMDQGKAAEFDTPKNLLQKGGMFCDLVQSARNH